MGSEITLQFVVGVLGSVAAVAAVSACDTLGLGGGGAGGAAPQGGSECQNKCSTDWDTAMNACATIANDTDRKACQDSADSVLKHCQGACDGDPVEQCKQKCDEQHDECHANCTKNDPTSACHAKCNDIYGKCLKDCEK